MPYQMDNGKWRAVRMINGKRKTKLFPTKSEAKKWEAAQSREEWEQKDSPIHSICWLDFLTGYLQFVQEKFCTKTFNEKKLAARISLQIISPEQKTLETTTSQAMQVLRLAAKDSGYKANKIRKNLAAAWAWGIRYYDLPKNNPFLDCERFPADQNPRRVPTMAEFWQVYKFANADDQVMLLLLLHTGARIGEVFRLVWDDLDFDNGRIRLGTRKTGGMGMRYAWLPMTTELNKALVELRQRYPFRKYVFERQIKGGQYTVRQHFMPKLCAAAGVEPFGFHGIRHLSATALAYAGVDLPTVQAMLRHSSPATTARYIKSLGIDKNKIENAFKEKGAKVVPFAPQKVV